MLLSVGGKSFLAVGTMGGRALVHTVPGYTADPTRSIVLGSRIDLNGPTGLIALRGTCDQRSGLWLREVLFEAGAGVHRRIRAHDVADFLRKLQPGLLWLRCSHDKRGVRALRGQLVAVSRQSALPIDDHRYLQSVALQPVDKILGDDILVVGHASLLHVSDRGGKDGMTGVHRVVIRRCVL